MTMKGRRFYTRPSLSISLPISALFSNPTQTMTLLTARHLDSVVWSNPAKTNTVIADGKSLASCLDAIIIGLVRFAIAQSSCFPRLARTFLRAMTHFDTFLGREGKCGQRILLHACTPLGDVLALGSCCHHHHCICSRKLLSTHLILFLIQETFWNSAFKPTSVRRVAGRR